MIIFILPLVIFTAYLLYVRFNKAKLAAVKKKHPKNSKNYEMYKIIYSKKTLVLSGYLSLILLSNFIVHAFVRSTDEKSTGALLFILVLTLLPFVVFIYWLKDNKRRKQK